MRRSRGIRRYFRQYNHRDMVAMMRNNKSSPEQCTEDFAGKTVVITGTTAGIGYATARKYAANGAGIVSVSRNSEKSAAVCREIGDEFGVPCREIIADLSRLEDMHRVGTELAAMDSPIDVLIHNAGVYLNHRVLTADGLETVFAVDYLSAFVITYLLRDKLSSQEDARILQVTSEGHRFAAWGLHLDDLNWERRKFSGMGGYGSAKLAQLLSMLRFQKEFGGTGVTINSMHPGAVRTNSGKENGRVYQWFKTNVVERNFRSVEISADALYYLGVSPDIAGVSGKFFNLTTEETPSPPAQDREVAEELWDISLRLGGLAQ